MTGLDRIIDDLRRFQREGIAEAERELDRALRRTAETSRGLVHHHTGAMAASQEVSSDRDPGGWTGVISYGTRGAAFERDRAGEHSAFLDSLARLSEPDFEAAIDRGFEVFR